ncbi:MAG: Pvc16 family protein [Rhizobacter sp.]
MFDQLDSALNTLLNEPALQSVLPELLAAETSFATPEKGHVLTKDTVNLFLFETKENRELRNALPEVQTTGNVGARRRATLRVDCSYMVTAWSVKKGIDKVAAEHRLLGQAFNWLSRFPRVPLRCFATAAQPAQVFEPPTMVAQMDGAKSAGEFWHALGVAPRPYFNLMVTVAMELAQAVEDSLVTTIATQYATDERLLIGGTVRDRDQRPVADAWVRLEPRGETTVTNAAGRFVFERAARGAGQTLRARASGFTEAVRTPLEVPSLSGDYDLTFP